MTRISVSQARYIQNKLRINVIKSTTLNKLEYVSGIDLTVIKNEKKLICGIVNFKYPEIYEVERVNQIFNETFPYIPGLLSFREGPAILKTYKHLKIKPDLLIFDGHGIAHPRGLGIASHIGVVLGIPSIGIAKKKLYGNYDEPLKEKGSFSYLKSPADNTVIGAVLRTKTNVKPVFISIGTKIDLPGAIDLAIKCNKGYRIPEPTRQADIYVKKLRKNYLDSAAL